MKPLHRQVWEWLHPDTINEISELKNRLITRNKALIEKNSQLIKVNDDYLKALNTIEQYKEKIGVLMAESHIANERIGNLSCIIYDINELAYVTNDAEFRKKIQKILITLETYNENR